MNFHKFVDHGCLEGLLMGGVFAFGCVTGQRPRTVSSIRLEHVTVKVVEVLCGGKKELFPSVRIVLVDQKCGDQHGYRSASEWLGDVSVEGRTPSQSFSYWIYKILNMRGAFKGGWDPLNGSKAGDVLQLKGECLDWFLYCDCVGDVHMDTMPVSKEKLGVWTSRVLERMGRLPRPYSAHRRGMVTRALSVNIYKNKGLGISGALENALLRVGGWDATVGGQTLRATYEGKSLEDLLDRQGLSNGSSVGDEVWRDRWKEIKGADIHLPCPVVQKFKRSSGCIGVKAIAMRDELYLLHMSKMNAAGQQVRLLWQGDYEICPIDRYDTERGLFSSVMKKYKLSECCRSVVLLRSQQLSVWKEAMDRARCRVSLLVLKHLQENGCSLDFETMDSVNVMTGSLLKVA